MLDKARERRDMIEKLSELPKNSEEFVAIFKSFCHFGSVDYVNLNVFDDEIVLEIIFTVGDSVIVTKIEKGENWTITSDCRAGSVQSVLDYWPETFDTVFCSGTDNEIRQFFIDNRDNGLCDAITVFFGKHLAVAPPVLLGVSGVRDCVFLAGFVRNEFNENRFIHGVAQFFINEGYQVDASNGSLTASKNFGSGSAEFDVLIRNSEARIASYLNESDGSTEIWELRRYHGFGVDSFHLLADFVVEVEDVCESKYGVFSSLKR